ncbi:MAG: CDP-alcohol phosphatidyltransferase family protein [Bacteroidota bacterium]|nr:CDP-alcohol phosphatidyltransferase family protein [Bacteroidota bacterium]
MNKNFNISNTLSVLRIVLVIPISLLLLNGEGSSKYIALTLIAVAIASDWFDGYFARKYNQVSDLGKILDPLGDKIAIGVIAVILVIQAAVPLWLMVAFILRDILILAGGLYMKKVKNILPQSNIAGKITVGIISVYLLLSILRYDELQTVTGVFLFLSLAFMILSFVLYVINFLNIIYRKV